MKSNSRSMIASRISHLKNVTKNNRNFSNYLFFPLLQSVVSHKHLEVKQARGEIAKRRMDSISNMKHSLTKKSNKWIDIQEEIGLGCFRSWGI